MREETREKKREVQTYPIVVSHQESLDEDLLAGGVDRRKDLVDPQSRVRSHARKQAALAGNDARDVRAVADVVHGIRVGRSFRVVGQADG